MLLSHKNISIAHQRSRLAAIDPAYSAEALLPSPDVRDGGGQWLYGAAELECFRLQLLRSRMTEAKLNVGYPGEFHQSSERAFFRHRFIGAGMFTFRASGEAVVFLDRREIFRAECGCCELSGDAQYLTLEIFATGDLPGLLVEDEAYRDWEWSADGVSWEIPAAFPQTLSGIAPHHMESPEIVLKPKKRSGNLYDFGVELLGTVVIHCQEKPEICAGESIEEAQNTNAAFFEQSMAVAAAGDGVWESAVPLAFRYLRVEAPGAAEVSCRAMFSPACYRGAFAASDPKLTEIWSHSAYTLRICMQDFLLDGIKRDRLPWVGDLMMSMMVDAHTFADAEIARRTLTVLGRAGIGRTHLNGIIDYTLWWVICHDRFQLYFDDKAFLRREWPRIEALMTDLESRCGEAGLLTVADSDWLFIDWIDGEKRTALQMLWYWALNAGTKLAERLNRSDCRSRWLRCAGIVAEQLRKTAWDPDRQWWCGADSMPARHAQFLSVLSGLATPAQREAVRRHLTADSLPPVGTPYMMGFELLALAELGEPDAMLARMNGCWGAMIDRGATTFHEAYDSREEGAAALSFYERPFGKSLCHAWSAGPAAVLPMGLFGLKPLADGWARFSIEPCAAKLDWIAAAVPTPHGTIEIEQRQGLLSLSIPPGLTALYGGREFLGQVTLPIYETTLQEV